MERSNVGMWGDIEQFVKTVEEDQREASSAKDYIEQIKAILLKYDGQVD
ncbi:hypothetical protein [Pseudalkalibacillus sp. JSM 102089]